MSKEIKIKRKCLYCGNEWEEYVTLEDINNILKGISIGHCPNVECYAPV